MPKITARIQGRAIEIEEERVKGAVDARHSTGHGSRRNPAIHNTTSQRGELTPSPTSVYVELQGQIPSGKNQIKIAVRQGRIFKYPDKRFTTWRQDALAQIHAQHGILAKPIWRRCSLSVSYTPGDHRIRDVSGMLDALFHVIVKAGLLKDDGLIKHVVWMEQPVIKGGSFTAFQLATLSTKPPQEEVMMTLQQAIKIVEDEVRYAEKNVMIHAHIKVEAVKVLVAAVKEKEHGT
jgi:Holliday junction resolvase RusA-like endonuclease